MSASSRVVLAVAVGLLVVGGVVGTVAVGVGPVADALSDDEPEFGLEEVDDSQVFVEPASSPEGDEYAELTGDGEIAVDIDGLSANSLTQVDDLIRVGFGIDDLSSSGGSDGYVNESAYFGFEATGPVEDDPDASVTFIDMRNGEAITGDEDKLEEDGLELEFGERAEVGVIVESGMNESVASQVTVSVKEPELADFQVEIDLDIEEDEPVAENEVLEGNNVTTNYNVTNAGSSSGTQDILFSVDDELTDQEDDVELSGGEFFEGDFVYQTTEDDVPEGLDEDPIELRVDTEDDSANETVLVMDEIHRYTDPDTREVTTSLFLESLNDWRADKIDTTFFLEILDAWRAGDEVAPSGELIED